MKHQKTLFPSHDKGGDTMFFDASLVVTFGNITNSGTSKIKATKDGKDVEFANALKYQLIRTTLQVYKQKVL